MAGARVLKGVANGLLSSFVSRNNDVGGYWAIGLLRKKAEHSELSILTLELLADFHSSEVTSQLAHRYRGWLLKQLEKNDFDCKDLKRAVIELEFSSFQKYPEAVRNTWGEPYKCTVHFTTASDGVVSATHLGVCAPHDARRELRSVRSESR